LLAPALSAELEARISTQYHGSVSHPLASPIDPADTPA
jgi:hypothetical protein